MLIEKIRWKDHPVLWNLELDFINPTTWKPYNTIVFAWENGTWKTTILESTSTFLNKGSFEFFESIEYVSGGVKMKAKPMEGSPIKDFFIMVDSSGNQTNMPINKNNPNSQLDNDPRNIRYNGCVLSKARADYKTKDISSSTATEIDLDKYDMDERDDFTSLKQLLIDIQTQDDSEYASLNRNLSQKWLDERLRLEFYTESKTYRFKRAFDDFFEKINYDKVSNLDRKKTILFLKNWKPVSIDNLSTWEKQIVFRWAYLLKNIGNLWGSAIMIDEPELSMHPKWEQKILNYYKGLFTKNDEQIARLFIATHLEHLLKDALKDKENNLVIVLKEESWSIQQRKIDAPSILSTITSAETNYLAFDIVSNDYHIELYWYLQNKESKNTVKSCDNFIKGSPLYNNTKHSKPSLYSTTNYETLPTYIRNAIDHPSTTWDFTEEELRLSIELLIELCK